MITTGVLLAVHFELAVVKALTVRNRGWQFETLKDGEACDDALAIRGCVPLGLCQSTAELVVSCLKFVYVHVLVMMSNAWFVMCMRRFLGCFPVPSLCFACCVYP